MKSILPIFAVFFLISNSAAQAQMHISYRGTVDGLVNAVNTCHDFLDQTKNNSAQESQDYLDAVQVLKDADGNLKDSIANLNSGSALAKDCKMNCAFAAASKSLSGCEVGKSRMKDVKGISGICAIFGAAVAKTDFGIHCKDPNQVSTISNEGAACVNYLAQAQGKITNECLESFSDYINDVKHSNSVVVTAKPVAANEPDKANCANALKDLSALQTTYQDAKKAVANIESTWSIVVNGKINPDYSATGTALKIMRDQCTSFVLAFPNPGCNTCSTIWHYEYRTCFSCGWYSRF